MVFQHFYFQSFLKPKVPIISFFFFVKTDVLIPLFSKTKKCPKEIFCYGQGILTIHSVFVEVHCIFLISKMVKAL